MNNWINQAKETTPVVELMIDDPIKGVMAAKNAKNLFVAGGGH